MQRNEKKCLLNIKSDYIMDGFFYDAQIKHIVEIVRNNLYFGVLENEDQKLLQNTSDTYYISTDDRFVYLSFYFDFGPLNISCLYKYCLQLNKLMNYFQGGKRIIHYTTANPLKRANAAFLLGCYSIIYLNFDPQEIYNILLDAGGNFKPFVDASQRIPQHTISLKDCFDAIRKACSYNFFDFNDFNVIEYDTLDKIRNGDMNWLVPRKFVAFISPSEKDSICRRPPQLYLDYFLNNCIKTVIRLNHKTYNAKIFTDAGVRHYELFFPDGTVPPQDILGRFLEIAENTPAAIAVHCKAGLGRTGSLIGAYLMKHYNMTALEAIAWMRICRPGAVIGQQQDWLKSIEKLMWKQGLSYRLQRFDQADQFITHKYGIYSIEWQKRKNNILKHEVYSLPKTVKQKAKTTSPSISSHRHRVEELFAALSINDPTEENPFGLHPKKILRECNTNPFYQLGSARINCSWQPNKIQKCIATQTNRSSSKNEVLSCTETSSFGWDDNIRDTEDATDLLDPQGDKLNEIKMKRAKNLSNMKRQIEKKDHNFQGKRKRGLLFPN